MKSSLSSNIDRKTASRLLKVSMRTLDRYIRSGKLLAKVDKGRVWLDKSQISNFEKWTSVPQRIPVTVKKIVHPVHAERKPIANDFYKDLYDEARKTLGDYQNKLEQSNYRIGQLESRILETRAEPRQAEPAIHIPKIIDRRDRDDYVSLEIMRKELSDKEKEVGALKEFLKNENAAKTIFAILTYVLLAALPTIWYLLR